MSGISSIQQAGNLQQCVALITHVVTQVLHTYSTIILDYELFGLGKLIMKPFGGGASPSPERHLLGKLSQSILAATKEITPPPVVLDKSTVGVPL